MSETAEDAEIGAAVEAVEDREVVGDLSLVSLEVPVHARTIVNAAKSDH